MRVVQILFSLSPKIGQNFCFLSSNYGTGSECHPLLKYITLKRVNCVLIGTTFAVKSKTCYWMNSHMKI